jgi:hypothetical protein
LADTLYGYSSGPQTPRPVALDSSTATVNIGDFMRLGTAGYYQACTATSDEPQCIAMEYSTAPSADGEKIILADFSTLSIYRYPPDTGTVVIGDRGKSCDIGGAQSVNRDASAQGQGGDGCLEIVDVDVAEQVLYVRLARPAFVGA